MANKIVLPSDLVKRFRYHYSKTELLLILPAKEKTIVEKNEEYWVAEKYRIVDDLIQYFSDYLYTAEKPKWIEASRMRQDFSRYMINITDISKSQLHKIDKKQCIQSGIPPSGLTSNCVESKPADFKKSDEHWRFRQYWNATHKLQWDDNPDVNMIFFSLRRIKPKYANFIDKHWSEKI